MNKRKLGTVRGADAKTDHHRTMHGVTAGIEHHAGSVVVISTPDGDVHRTFSDDYGYVVKLDDKAANVMSHDGSSLDVYVGLHDKARRFYLVSQLFHQGDKKGMPDEPKVMMGYPSKAAAVEAYRAHTADGMFGGAIEFSRKRFRAQLQAYIDSGSTGPIQFEVAEEQVNGMPWFKPHAGASGMDDEDEAMKAMLLLANGWVAAHRGKLTELGAPAPRHPARTARLSGTFADPKTVGGWVGWIEPDDWSWIAFVAMDGLVLLWEQRAPDGAVIGEPVAFYCNSTGHLGTPSAAALAAIASLRRADEEPADNEDLEDDEDDEEEPAPEAELEGEEDKGIPPMLWTTPSPTTDPSSVSPAGLEEGGKDAALETLRAFAMLHAEAFTATTDKTPDDATASEIGLWIVNAGLVAAHRNFTIDRAFGQPAPAPTTTPSGDPSDRGTPSTRTPTGPRIPMTISQEGHRAYRTLLRKLAAASLLVSSEELAPCQPALLALLADGGDRRGAPPAGEPGAAPVPRGAPAAVPSPVPAALPQDVAPGACLSPHGASKRTALVTVRAGSIRKEDRIATFIASTDAVDSYGEIVDQSDWQFDRFKKNPVILFAHKSCELPIGKAVKWRVEKEGGRQMLVIDVYFSQVNPFAELCWLMVQEGTLSAGSVGFMPGGFEERAVGGRKVIALIHNDLFEFSICPVPANPEAVVLMEEHLMRAFDVMKRAGEELERVVGAYHAPVAADPRQLPQGTDPPPPVATPAAAPAAPAETQAKTSGPQIALAEIGALALFALTAVPVPAQFKTGEPWWAHLKRELEQRGLVLVAGDPSETIQLPAPAKKDAVPPAPAPVPQIERGAVPYKKFPTSDAAGWDAAAAEKRVRKACSTDKSGDADQMDWPLYRSCFAWYDSKTPEAFGSYKLLHTDVIDGKLTTMRAGLIAAGDVVMGARGGVGDDVKADIAAVKGHLARHYKEFEMVAPWDKEEAIPIAAGRGHHEGDMHIKTLKDAHVLESLRTGGFITLALDNAEGGQTEVRVELPNVAAALRAAETKATQFETKNAELDTRATKAESDLATEKTAHTKTLAELTELQLAPLVGLEPWQITPAEAKSLAKVRGSDAETYASLLAERTQRFEEGSKKAKAQSTTTTATTETTTTATDPSAAAQRVPATRAPDPTPTTQQGAGEDPAMVAIRHNVEELKKERAAARS